VTLSETPVHGDMSIHIESDGTLMESTMTPFSSASILNTPAGDTSECRVNPVSTVSVLNAPAGDTSFYPAAPRKQTSSRRVINRCRSTTSAESTRSFGPGTTQFGPGATPITARQSLLGRPVNVRPSRRDARYRRFQVAVYNFQFTVYNFLERPKSWRSILYHLLV